ncbi:hypothetical protein J4430_01020 [Candidatus Woesearchaeota archaeon]|nr:hypothetical protein [Candidatus Woesearchaeota archaeon]
MEINKTKAVRIYGFYKKEDKYVAWVVKGKEEDVTIVHNKKELHEAVDKYTNPP